MYLLPEYYHRGARVQCQPTTRHGVDRPVLARGGGLSHSSWQKAPSGSDPFPQGLHRAGIKKYHTPAVRTDIKQEKEEKEEGPRICQLTMVSGARCSAAGCDHCNPPRVVEKVTYVESPYDAQHREQLGQLHMENKALESQVAEMEQMIADKKDKIHWISSNWYTTQYGLDTSYNNVHYYKCKVEWPGVGYRHTPLFADKRSDGRGPVFPEVVEIDRVCQGPGTVFGRCTNAPADARWVPLIHPNGDKLFDKISKHQIAEQGLKMTSGNDKLVAKNTASPMAPLDTIQ